MYYKASIMMSSENMLFNKDGEYEGNDPDSYQVYDIRDITDKTLEGLKKKIESEFFNLDKPIGADVQIFENRIEIQYEGEHDYRIPKAEQIPFIETASIIISKVVETDIDLKTNKLFKNIEGA